MLQTNVAVLSVKVSHGQTSRRLSVGILGRSVVSVNGRLGLASRLEVRCHSRGPGGSAKQRNLRDGDGRCREERASSEHDIDRDGSGTAPTLKNELLHGARGAPHAGASHEGGTVLVALMSPEEAEKAQEAQAALGADGARSPKEPEPKWPPLRKKSTGPGPIWTSPGRKLPAPRQSSPARRYARRFVLWSASPTSIQANI